MPWRELTCDDTMSTEELYRGSMRLMPDGSYAQRVVKVGGGGANGDFNDDWNGDFNNQGS